MHTDIAIVPVLFVQSFLRGAISSQTPCVLAPAIFLELWMQMYVMQMQPLGMGFPQYVDGNIMPNDGLPLIQRNFFYGRWWLYLSVGDIKMRLECIKGLYWSSKIIGVDPFLRSMDSLATRLGFQYQGWFFLYEQAFSSIKQLLVITNTWVPLTAFLTDLFPCWSMFWVMGVAAAQDYQLLHFLDMLHSIFWYQGNQTS